MSDNRILTQEEIQALIDGGLSEEGSDQKENQEEIRNSGPLQEIEPGQRDYKAGKKEARNNSGANLDLVLDMPLEVSVILGSRKIDIKSLLEVSPGSLIELQKKLGEPVEIYTNGKLLARGEIVSIDENFGVRITEIVKPVERLQNLKEK